MDRLNCICFFWFNLEIYPLDSCCLSWFPFEDKQELLKQFVQHNELLESVETTLKISREQSGEVEHARELLTIKEMREKGFSQKLCYYKMPIRFMLPQCLHCVCVSEWKGNTSVPCCSYYCCWKYICLSSPKNAPRMKIETIIGKSTPVPDSDVPDCPESVRFWCNTGGRSSQKETTRLTADAETRIATSMDGLAGMLAGPDVGVSAAAAGVGTANRPTIKALVDVASAVAADPPAPKAKAKSKAKAKAKAAAKVPKTPAEQRNAIRTAFGNYSNVTFIACFHKQL